MKDIGGDGDEKLPTGLDIDGLYIYGRYILSCKFVVNKYLMGITWLQFFIQLATIRYISYTRKE